MILDYLTQNNILSLEQRTIIETENQQSGRSVESLLLDMGILNEERLLGLVSNLRQYPVVALDEYKHHIPTLKSFLPYNILEKYLAVPILWQEEEGRLTVAMADMGHVERREAIIKALKIPANITFVLAKKSEISQALALLAPEPEIQIQAHKIIDEKVVHEFLYHILTKGVQSGASDIHFEPERFYTRVRYRCDGLLTTVKIFHASFWNGLCVQLKILSTMDIAECRRPQDGRFSLSLLGRSVDFRCSSHPTAYGENIVLRILDQEKTLIPLEDLGYTQHNLERLQALLHKPEGLVIITGPTGSGKTTSLYSILSRLDLSRLNVMTLEEPIECHIPGLRQSEIRDSTVLSFASGMHSILRQDPDVILIGEVRDEKTAEMAVRASMTGHLVFTTLHTTSALGTIYRLKELNIPLSFLSGVLNGIVAQRLIRLLCPHCKEPITLPPEEAQKLNIWPQCTVFRAKGCQQCHLSGYKGRRTVAEVLLMNPWLEEMIFNQASHGELLRALAQSGFRTLIMDALDAVMVGQTSIEEVQRALGFSHGPV